jgi:hypothetical protein
MIEINQRGMTVFTVKGADSGLEEIIAARDSRSLDGDFLE